MKSIFQTVNKGWIPALALLALTSCNKDLPVAEPIVSPTPTGQSIAELVTSNANYSFLAAAITRAGTGLTVNPADRTAVYTVFAPDNEAFIASGIPSIDVINSLPAAQVAAIVNYHFIGGQRLRATDIPTTFPNLYNQSSLILAQSTPISPRMAIFPSRRGSSAWVNQIPIKSTNLEAANGVIHTPARVLMPPTRVVAQIATGDTSFTFLVAAILHADKAPPTGAPKLLDVVSNPLANLTVFAPTNAAFRTVLAALGLPPVIESINRINPTQLWGIVAYHVVGVRAFGVNLPAGDNTLPSLIGVAIQSRVDGSGVQVRGNGNIAPTPGGPVAFFARVTTPDVMAINGVVHVVNQVLLPQ
jgi:uncharacterized surface protein with fasciclin (FAS1) repeats